MTLLRRFEGTQVQFFDQCEDKLKKNLEICQFLCTLEITKLMKSENLCKFNFSLSIEMSVHTSLLFEDM